MRERSAPLAGSQSLRGTEHYNKNSHPLLQLDFVVCHRTPKDKINSTAMAGHSPSSSPEGTLADPTGKHPKDPPQDLDLEKTPTTAESVLGQPPTRKVFPETDLDRGIVGWESQEDPAHPLNFPASRKWTVLGFVSAVTFISPLASSMFSPALKSLSEDLGVTDQTLLSLSVSIYLLGYTVNCAVPGSDSAC